MSPSVPVTYAVNVLPGELASLANSTDKGIHDHGFVEVYERFFFQYRYKPIRILEIGIYNGDSLKLWGNYFQQASIFGIDISPKIECDTDVVKTFVADQSNRTQLQSFIDAHGGDFDFIIDDGGHSMEQQQVSFGFLFPFVKPGGYYVIEDLHTSIPSLHPEFSPTPETSTLVMIENFVKRMPPHLQSKYMRPYETEYIQLNIELISLNARNRAGNGRSVTCLFQKKT